MLRCWDWSDPCNAADRPGRTAAERGWMIRQFTLRNVFKFRAQSTHIWRSGSCAVRRPPRCTHNKVILSKINGFARCFAPTGRCCSWAIKYHPTTAVLAGPDSCKSLTMFGMWFGAERDLNRPMYISTPNCLASCALMCSGVTNIIQCTYYMI